MISNKCFYALKAMLELAAREGNSPVTIGEIADARGIPVRFLESIMRQLKQAQLAESVRGKAGGYYLAKPASRIKLGQIIDLFEGPIFIATGARPASRGAHDVFHHVWQKAEAALGGVLNNISIAELADKERELHTGISSTYTI